MNSTVVVYYSKDNNTRTGAKILSDRIGAKIVELTEIRKGNFIQALTKKSSKLAGDPWGEIKDAKIIYLMSPIWASNGVPAVNAFLDKADLTNKEVTIITFQQFADLRNSDNVHNYFRNKVQDKNGIVLDCYAFLGGKMGHCAEEIYIRTQIDKLFPTE
ncbi:conserved protein of unknown function [Petrocella atlantisensis]|uniref:Flavodoxin-like domain-containing protein n=1 Tax=Petrocella atlantisensis TaxID=2173034 RepID=A0A3P7Q1C5_9FIRM|nr:hypothetical protein [Petrocella atlantisensis]VDN49161.1 conserved protein of unknown function [Petrocella atlantisensis]